MHHKGNSKLGSNVSVISRPVGKTCPSSCYFLGNGCYAEQTEKRFPKSRTYANQFLSVDSGKLYGFIREAFLKQNNIRIHERGDFLVDNKLDLKYVLGWSIAIKKYIKEHGEAELPYIWSYTHAYYRTISNLNNLSSKVNIYASVHNDEDIAKAKKAGFTLFALIKGDKPHYTKREKKPYNLKVSLDGLQLLKCPEQVIGREQVTCDKCTWCIKGRGHVNFLEH